MDLVLWLAYLCALRALGQLRATVETPAAGPWSLCLTWWER